MVYWRALRKKRKEGRKERSRGRTCLHGGLVRGHVIECPITISARQFGLHAFIWSGTLSYLQHSFTYNSFTLLVLHVYRRDVQANCREGKHLREINLAIARVTRPTRIYVLAGALFFYTNSKSPM